MSFHVWDQVDLIFIVSSLLSAVVEDEAKEANETQDDDWDDAGFMKQK